MQGSKRRTWARILGFVFLAILAAEAVFLYIRWPFTNERIAESLQGRTGTRVRFAKFRPTFFPHPGCQADDASFKRGGVKLGSVRKLTIIGSWAALFTLQHYVSRMELEGARISIPRDLPPPELGAKKQKTETTVGELVADGAILEVHTQRFTFPRLTLHNVAKSKTIRFDTDLTIPKPAGRVHAFGSFGPWQSGSTPVSGSFRIQESDLSSLGEIAGTLSANGEFKGILKRIEVSGETHVPNFRVKRHPVQLRTRYSATVNAVNGHVSIQDVNGRFLDTELQATGAVENDVATVDFASDHARIQDLMLLFTQGDRPALKGPITLRAHAVLPPGEDKFLPRLRIDGEFGIRQAEFTRSRTQSKVNELSARARGKDVGEDDPAPERVVSDLKGRVVMRNGIATLSDISFVVPGATANGGGTYNLLDKRVNLHGKLAMKATASEASSGIKSILLKPFDSLFKRKNSGAVLPVSVTGYYPRPNFRVSLTDGK
jgi:hypothetical protein